MQSSFTDYPQKCTVCGHLKTLPYTFNSTVPPVMCKCPKSPTIAWECFRCHKINAPWKGSCDCTPPDFNWAPTSDSNSKYVNFGPYNSSIPDPFAPEPPNI